MSNSISMKKGEAKRFSWLKLGPELLGELPIRLLRYGEVGLRDLSVYFMLMLMSVKSEGVICFSGLNSIPRELSMLLNISKRSAERAWGKFLAYGLVEHISDNEYIVTYAVNSIGSESESAERVRRYRQRQKASAESSGISDASGTHEISTPAPETGANAMIGENDIISENDINCGILSHSEPDNGNFSPASEESAPNEGENEEISPTDEENAPRGCSGGGNTDTTAPKRGNTLHNAHEHRADADKNKFTPPKLGEVKEYANKMGYTSVDCARFYNNYKAKGWRVNGLEIYDWRPLLSQWEDEDRRRALAKEISTPSASGGAAKRAEKLRYGDFDPNEALLYAIERSREQIF